MRVRELLFDIEVWGSEKIRSADGAILIRKLKNGRYHACFAKNNYKVYELSKAGLIQFLYIVKR